MHRLFKKEEVLTIPNLLSLVRLLLIVPIVWLYVGKEQYMASLGFILLSGATDVLDGYIARHFHMISDLGKILDPLADKLTQFAMILCLHSRYPGILYLLVLFVVKELIMAFCGWMALHKKDSVNSSQWFGKAATVTLYATMALLFVLPEVSQAWANLLFLVCGGMSMLSLVKYLLFYRTLFAG